MGNSTLKCLSECLIFILSTFIFWTVFPFVYVIVSPLYFYRGMVKVLAKLLHPEWVGMMNCRDVFVCEKMNQTSGLTSVVSLVFVLSGDPDLHKIRNHFQNKVLLQKDKRGELCYTKFKYYYEYFLGFPFWKMAKNFNLRNHIRLLEETKERKQTTEHEFLDVMSSVSTKVFSPQMPPWEMLIIPNYVNDSENPENGNNNNNNNNNNNQVDYKEKVVLENNNVISSDGRGDADLDKKFILIFRFHHTLLDGFSVVKLVVENFGGLQKEKITKAPKSKPKLSFFNVAKIVVDAVVNVGIAHLKILLLDMDFNSWHIPLRKLTGKWHTVMTEKIPFDLARQTSKDLGVATTTVLFGSIASGIRKYLVVQKGMSEKEIPNVIRGLFPLPVPGHPLDGMINHWSFANIPMDLKHSDAAVRLRKMNEEFDKIKKSVIPALVWFFSPLYMGVPNWLVELWGVNRMTTLTLSSFPGPKSEIVFFENWRILDTFYFLPRLKGNPSMHLAILTYNGNIRITLTVDKAVMPDRAEAQKLIHCVQEEMFSFQTLKNCPPQVQEDFV